MPPPTTERAQAVHSLPSFAQAFSSLSGNDDRALPPIQSHHRSGSHHRRERADSHSQSRESSTRSPPVHSRGAPPAGQRPAPPSSSRPPYNQQTGGGVSLPRKRPRAPSTSLSSVRNNDHDDDGYESSGSDDTPPPPPPSNRVIKSEHTDAYDKLSRSPSPARPHASRQKPSQARHDSSPVPPSRDTHLTTISGGATPAPSLSRPPPKRRRFTISGSNAAHPLSQTHSSLGLNTSNLVLGSPSPSLNPVGAGSTPISPVVMGFTIQKGDPAAIEQVRSMLNLKQKQKALIESRRGSVAGVDGGAASPPIGKRGSIAGLHGDILARRGSLPALQVVPSVNIVNPPPGSSLVSNQTPVKRGTGPSPNGGLQRQNSNSGSQPQPAANSVAFASSTGNSNAHATNPNPSSSPVLRQGAVPGRVSNGAGGPARTNSPANHAVPSQSTHNPPQPRPYHGQTTNPQQRSPPTSHPHGQQPAPPPSASQSNVNHTQQHQQQQQSQAAHLASQGLTALANALPPPPTSFAMRRAGQLGGRGNKPADIVVVSPRDTETSTNSASIRKTPSQLALNSANAQAQPALVKSPLQVPSQQSIRSRSNYLALQPSIQSAPAVPRPGQTAGRFPMTIPSLPGLPTISNQSQAQAGKVVAASGPVPPSAGPRRVIPGHVPPTPTRLSMQRAQGTTTETANVRLSQPTNASLALPMMPKTPATSFHAAKAPAVAGSSSGQGLTANTVGTHGPTAAEKQAFLAPFEQFYDALADARTLKCWFGEQLTRVGKVVREVEVEKAEVARLKEELSSARAGPSADAINRAVAQAVSEATRGWKEEVLRLQTRVNQLERSLGSAGRNDSGVVPMDQDLPSGPGGGISVTSKSAERPSVNGLSGKGRRIESDTADVDMDIQPDQSYPTAPDSYTFPPAPAPAPGIAPTRSAPPATGSSGSDLISSPDMSRQQRSVSPLLRMTLSTSTGSNASYMTGPGLAAGNSNNSVRWSTSRSEASSPAPSVEHGHGRGPSVSAMRFEPPASMPASRSAPSSSQIASSAPPRVKVEDANESSERRGNVAGASKGGEESSAPKRRSPGSEGRSPPSTNTNASKQHTKSPAAIDEG
ncbi:hypothetical protein SCHPADRAFT_996318 [Schizopora paradoxa]|uniref:Uncharacterized protein n=1 Tax=Schizopora paradoxa TaxID=27342 RepID=A0A0H2SCW9_9AGAM|nr:hypothetical protein SCHPADRAFT_996318 [Schizopora paradoxa]